jgi:ubiquinone/menaquinone biosynthesis C-methylase UbiE
MDVKVKYSFEPFADMREYKEEANRAAIRDLSAQLSLPTQGWVVLDVATGVGTIIELLWQELLSRLNKGTIIGVDLAEGAIHLASERLKEAAPNLVRGVAQHLPVQGGVAQLVTAGNVIHNLSLQDKKRSLREAFRVLQPGGLFWCSTTFYSGAVPEGNAARYNAATISAAVRLIQSLTPPIVRQREARPEARNWLSTEGYEQLVSEAGFVVRKVVERTVNVYIDTWKAICGYSEYAAGALHGYPVEVACEILPKAAEIAMEQHGLLDDRGQRYIPRRWFELVALKPS